MHHFGEACKGPRRFVKRVKHSMTFRLVIEYETSEMRNKTEEQDFWSHRSSKCGVIHPRLWHWTKTVAYWIIASGASIYRLTSELRVKCPDKHVQIVRITEWLFCGLKRYLMYVLCYTFTFPTVPIFSTDSFLVWLVRWLARASVA